MAGPLTAGFVSVGRHGTGSLYAGSSSRGALRRKTGRIRGWLAEGPSASVHFDNGTGANAVADIVSLKELRT